MSTEVALVWSGKAVLGEGPVWDCRDSCLWFVDIKQHAVYRLDPATAETRRWQAPGQVGWILPATGGGFLAGVQGGLYHFTPDDGKFCLLVPIEADLKENRLNDATIASDGSVWFGTMHDATEEPTGSVYRYDGRKASETTIAKAVVTNGPAVSPDGTTLYHVDTVAGRVIAFPISAIGELGAASDVIRLDPAEGYPDGVTVDSAGNLWMGVWGGGCARCYSSGGELLRQVDLPASNVTKIALGGTELTTAYATTARIGLDAATLARQPDAGGVFSFDVDVPGQKYPLAPVATISPPRN